MDYLISETTKFNPSDIVIWVNYYWRNLNFVGVQTLAQQILYINGNLIISASGTSNLGTNYNIGVRYGKSNQNLQFNGSVAQSLIYKRLLNPKKYSKTITQLNPDLVSFNIYYYVYLFNNK